MSLQEKDVLMVQIDGPKRRVHEVPRRQSHGGRAPFDQTVSRMLTYQRRNINGSDRNSGFGIEKSTN
jgi:hypothetical protein